MNAELHSFVSHEKINITKHLKHLTGCQAAASQENILNMKETFDVYNRTA